VFLTIWTEADLLVNRNCLEIGIDTQISKFVKSIIRRRPILEALKVSVETPADIPATLRDYDSTAGLRSRDSCGQSGRPGPDNMKKLSH
jgi:hypothetical protein